MFRGTKIFSASDWSDNVWLAMSDFSASYPTGGGSVHVGFMYEYKVTRTGIVNALTNLLGNGDSPVRPAPRITNQ